VIKDPDLTADRRLVWHKLWKWLTDNICAD